MPELPEVETVKQGLSPFMAGAVIDELILNRENLRFPFPKDMANICSKTTIEHIGRRAKFLIFSLSNDWCLISHLGMSGRYIIEQSTQQNNNQNTIDNDMVFTHASERIKKHDHVVFKMQNGTHVIFNDPRRFGYMDIIRKDELENSKHMEGLGPEPLSNHFSAQTLIDAGQGKKRPTKLALLDQKIVAGLGNIYVCEALFRAKIHPEKLFADVVMDKKQCSELVRHIQNVLKEAIESGGSSLKDHRQANGDLGYFQHQFKVYGRENDPCYSAGCDANIRRITQSGRSTFYCEACQN